VADFTALESNPNLHSKLKALDLANTDPETKEGKAWIWRFLSSQLPGSVQQPIPCSQEEREYACAFVSDPYNPDLGEPPVSQYTLSLLVEHTRQYWSESWIGDLLTVLHMGPPPLVPLLLLMATWLALLSRHVSLLLAMVLLTISPFMLASLLQTC
jgi:hypothetical protein